MEKRRYTGVYVGPNHDRILGDTLRAMEGDAARNGWLFDWHPTDSDVVAITWETGTPPESYRRFH